MITIVGPLDEIFYCRDLLHLMHTLNTNWHDLWVGDLPISRDFVVVETIEEPDVRRIAENITERSLELAIDFPNLPAGRLNSKKD